MSNHIIDPNGAPESPPPPTPPPPISMEDLLNRAHNAWQFKRKDEAVKLMIAGMRLISQGIAQSLNDLEIMKKQLSALCDGSSQDIKIGESTDKP